MSANEPDTNWESCTACRGRPHSMVVDAAHLDGRLPAAWRRLGATTPAPSWTGDVRICRDCETRWLIRHDTTTGLVEDMAPLPDELLPLLRSDTGLLAILPLLVHAQRGNPRSWVQERVDDWCVGWFAETSTRPTTAAAGLLNAATAPDRTPAERATAMRSLAAVIERARRQGTTLTSGPLMLLDDPVLRRSGPHVIDALRRVLVAGLTAPPVLQPDPQTTRVLTALQEAIADVARARRRTPGIIHRLRAWLSPRSR